MSANYSKTIKLQKTEVKANHASTTYDVKPYHSEGHSITYINATSLIRPPVENEWQSYPHHVHQTNSIEPNESNPSNDFNKVTNYNKAQQTEDEYTA